MDLKAFRVTQVVKASAENPGIQATLVNKGLLDQWALVVLLAIPEARAILEDKAFPAKAVQSGQKVQLVKRGQVVQRAQSDREVFQGNKENPGKTVHRENLFRTTKSNE